MILVLIISLSACVGMITLSLVKPKVRIKKISLGTYWMIPVLGAVLLIALRLISPKEVYLGLTAKGAINPVKILLLFISMTVLSIFLDETGFFKYLANSVLKRTGSNQIKLFTVFYATISILTIFTSNDIIILTFTPFVCYFSKNAKINPLPYLILEFVAANTCSMLFIIGNPTNIFLATANGIDFVKYLKVMALPTLFAIIVAYFVMLLLFYKNLKMPISGSAEKIVIEKKSLLIIGLLFLSCSTVLLAISAYINIEMWLIAVLFAIGLVILVLIVSLSKRTAPKEITKTLKRAPWELIPFVVSMFTLVLTLEKYQFTSKLAELLGEHSTILVYGAASTLFANLINNIPMSVFFSSLIQNLHAASMNPAIFAVIIGSNIGAFLTPVGALAGIMWLGLLKDNKINFTFLQFLKYGIIISIPTLFAALFGLMLIL